MYEELRNYFKDNNFKIVYTDKYLNIINYLKILILENDRIEVKIPNKILKIVGNNLKLKRCLNNELLVIGDIFEFKLVDLWTM